MCPIKRLIGNLIHLRALNTFDLLFSPGTFVAFILVVPGADRERERVRARRAQRTDFLEAYKQTKKHLKVNKNLIPKIQFQFGTDADVDADVEANDDSDGDDDGNDDGAASTTQNRKEVNGNDIKSQFHQWAGKAVVPSIPPSLRSSVCLSARTVSLAGVAFVRRVRVRQPHSCTVDR